MKQVIIKVDGMKCSECESRWIYIEYKATKVVEATPQLHALLTE